MPIPQFEKPSFEKEAFPTKSSEPRTQFEEGPGFAKIVCATLLESPLHQINVPVGDVSASFRGARYRYPCKREEFLGRKHEVVRALVVQAGGTV